MRALLPVPLLGLLVFCLYGFTTTFEPWPAEGLLAWRIVYGVGGLTCLVVLTLILAASVRADARRRPGGGVRRSGPERAAIGRSESS